MRNNKIIIKSNKEVLFNQMNKVTITFEQNIQPNLKFDGELVKF